MQDEPPKKRMRLKGSVGSNYDCPHGYCNRSFAQKRDLRNHQNKNHLCIEKVVDCEVCSTDTAESIEISILSFSAFNFWKRSESS